MIKRVKKIGLPNFRKSTLLIILYILVVLIIQNVLVQSSALTESQQFHKAAIWKFLNCRVSCSMYFYLYQNPSDNSYTNVSKYYNILLSSAPSNAKLQKRIDGADIIVKGNITSIAPIAKMGSLPVTEHEANWNSATIYIEQVIKGRHTSKEIILLFPLSLDVKYNFPYQSPKFHVNQEGIFLLHKQQIKELNMEAFTALDPTDFQPKDQLAHIEAVVRSSSSYHSGLAQN